MADRVPKAGVAASETPDSPRSEARDAGAGFSGVTGVEFHVADIEASIRFYEALGFRVTRRWEDWVRLDRDGAELVLMGDAYVRSHDHYFTPYLDRSPGSRGRGQRRGVRC